MFKTGINIIILFLLFGTAISAQNVAHVKTGILLVSLHNDEFSFRPGINLGIQAKIGAPGFFMSPGLFYQKFTISEFAKKKYINGRPKYHNVKINVDGGFEYNLTKLFKYRIYAGVDLNRIIKIDNNSKNINFNNVHDGFFSFDYGFGFSFYFMTIDFKQERSLTEFYKDYKKTKLNLSTISLGFVF